MAGRTMLWKTGLSIMTSGSKRTTAFAQLAAARLVNSAPSGIALVKNTSEGIATIAMGLDWRVGDTIVAFNEEFPANQYPWKRLESKGVKITWLSVTDPLDKIDEAAKGARLLAISYVQFLTGYRVDLGKIRRDFAGAEKVIYFVDADSGSAVVFPWTSRLRKSMRCPQMGTDGLWDPKDAGSYIFLNNFQGGN